MNELTIIIKTIDRYNSLKKLVKSILKYYPNISILIGDDGLDYCGEKLKIDFPNQFNIISYHLPLDSGLSYGRNFLVSKVKTKYLLLCDDDFIFDKKSDLQTALNILKEKKLDIIGGYFRNYKIVKTIFDRFICLGQKIFRYELATNYIGKFELNNKKLNLNFRFKDFPDYEETSFVMNFFVAKTSSIKKVLWDEDLKVMEHEDFFIRASQKGLKVAFTNKLSIQHHPVHSRKYKQRRRRDFIPLFMSKNNLEIINWNYDVPKKNKVTIFPKTNLKVSIIVPVYNVKNNLKQLIDVLTNQSYPNIEILLVDNNSTDGSYELMMELEQKYSKIKVLREEKQGPNYARYKGFCNATGDYIYFCDADDLVDNNCIFNFVKEIEKSKADIVVADYDEINEKGYLLKHYNGIFSKDLSNQKSIYLLAKVALWNKIFKKSLISDDSFAKTKIGQDSVITLLAIQKAEKLSYLPYTVYNYIPLETGITASLSGKKIIALIETFKILREKSQKIDNYKHQEEIEFVIFSHLIYKMLRFSLIKNKEERKSVYNGFKAFIKTTNYKKNRYYQKNFSYKIASFLVLNEKVYDFSLTQAMLKMLWTNKLINRCLKKLDK